MRTRPAFLTSQGRDSSLMASSSLAERNLWKRTSRSPDASRLNSTSTVTPRSFSPSLSRARTRGLPNGCSRTNFPSAGCSSAVMRLRRRPSVRVRPGRPCFLSALRSYVLLTTHGRGVSRAKSSTTSERAHVRSPPPPPPLPEALADAASGAPGLCATARANWRASRASTPAPSSALGSEARAALSAEAPLGALSAGSTQTPTPLAPHPAPFSLPCSFPSR
mmetsp:Transcript_15936/g.36978  ORF Transcript_15936/g.36978 Transcript_15936/m.36978 type:complete len:221 (-) Transcript_15936:516-1178(-)